LVFYTEVTEMGGGASNAAQNYVPEDDLPKEQTAEVQVSFYGMGKPLDKGGKDKGLKEVWSSWAFPQSDEKSAIILPAVVGVHGDWSQTRLSSEYDKRLAAYGLSEENLKQIIEKLNALQKAFFPFQRDRKPTRKTNFTERGIKAFTKGIDSETETFYYAIQMRKILAKAGMDFPNTNWSLHIHKHMMGSDSSYFTEVVYHTVRIQLSEDMPKWWDAKKHGTGSAWHTWDQSHSSRNFEMSKKLSPNGPGEDVIASVRNMGGGKQQLPEVEVTKGNSPLAKQPLASGGIDKNNNLAAVGRGSPCGGPPASAVAGTADADARKAKRKGSASDTFAGLEQFSANANAACAGK